MLIPLPTPDEMTAWEIETIERIGIPALVLMENASREACRALLQEYGNIEKTEILCFAGGGNNGGDSFAMARLLHDHGADVTILHTKPQEAYTDEAKSNLSWAKRIGVHTQYIEDETLSDLSQPDIIIDGLLGTGFKGPAKPQILGCIRKINSLSASAFVISLDIPSGLNGQSGQAEPDAVRADMTVTFQAAKLGLALPESEQYTGTVVIADIGIPRVVQSQNSPSHSMITSDLLGRIPVPTDDMHKNSAGHVLIVGGSKGLTGAPHLSALAAMRSGAGLVTIACPGALTESVKSCSPDIMTLGLGTTEFWSAELFDILAPELERFDTVVIGPGLGRASKTVDFFKAFIAKCPPQTVIDADALFCLAQIPEALKRLSANVILTPHPGEMATLLGNTASEIQNNRLETARHFSEIHDAVLILKGARTLIAQAGKMCLSPYSESNLAVAGSGDVLAGIIASLTAKDIEPLEAACIAVCWHGLAGAFLKKDFPARGNMATDIINALPKTVKRYIEGATDAKS